MGEGYLPISRAIFEHRFWCKRREFSKFEAWLYLIKEARFEDAKICDGNKIIEIKRGQIYASIRFLASAFGWSRHKVTNFLDLLVSDNGIKKETVSETGQTLITLCNYDKYNSMQKEAGTGKGTPRGQYGDSTGTKYNELNELNKLNNNIPPIIPRREMVDLSFCDEAFIPIMERWVAYRKEIKKPISAKESIQRQYSKLAKLSGGDPDMATLIVDQSITEGWTGLFALKETTPDIRLGYDERIENGRRTYGTGSVTIPMTAPPRPSGQYVWNASRGNWIILG